jgi:hypothetical protein
VKRKEKPSGTEAVVDFLATTQHPLKPGIEELRRIILAAGVPLTEQIKWNAPSFCAEGEDRMTFKLNSPEAVEIVFHRGAKVKALPAQNLIEDPHGLLKWATTDRAVARFTSLDEIREKEKPLTEVVKRWIIAATDTPE